MGQNLARNIARNGFPIAVHNRSSEKTDEFIERFAHEGDFTPAHTLQEFVAALQTPRAILIMVKAGKPVDDVIQQLLPLLSTGDLLIDGGNSLFTDTERRVAELAPKGIHFLGTGVSGGEEGALNGPSIMPGGPREAYTLVQDIFTAIAAKVDGTPCCAYIGEGGSGHYVKMVHNGIEYADMQLIAEAYDLLRHAGGLSNEDLAQTFEIWNNGELNSFLIEITAQIFRTKDPETGGHLVDFVLDKAGNKGTGKWTSQSSLDLGVAAPAIAESVFARFLSTFKEQRTAAAEILPGPKPATLHNTQAFIEDVRQALYAAKVVAYAQGFDQMLAAAAEYGWTLNPGEIATIWRGGCIIRAQFLNRIKEAYDTQPQLPNLLLAPYFTQAVADAQQGWRRVISTAVEMGIPTPLFSSALAYYDGYRRAHLPANLIQAQRDLFGAHTYQRTDRPGTYHSKWGA
jgi:6-phosphogluconate dehydrogenase